jgi:allophanate hydrolase
MTAAVGANLQTHHIDLVVVGAHLSGLPLNGELKKLGAELVRADITAPVYRLYELAGTSPRKPGMLRVADGGSAIAVEVWRLAVPAFGEFVASVPQPLSIGSVILADGLMLKGFLVEAIAVSGAHDISEFGGWREYAQRPELV